MKGVMDEQLLIWRLNGRPQRPLDCSPGGEENLLTGLLLTGMAVSDPAKIRGVVRKGDVWEVRTDGGDRLPDLAARLGMIPFRAVRPPAREEAEDVDWQYPAQEGPVSLRKANDEMIEKALQKHGGKVKAAAAELGISERTIYRKLAELKAK